MKNLLYLILLILSISCVEKEKSWERKARLRNDFVQSIKKEEKIKYVWEDLNYKFTSQYDSVINSELQIVESPEILDILKKSNGYEIKILAGFYPPFYFDLYATDSNLIEQIVNWKQYEKDLIFIVSIDNIEKDENRKNPKRLPERLRNTKYDFTFYGTGELIKIYERKD